ncbi:MAG TPA: transcriptional activator RfaH [Xanthobacteraceae bacterium]|jgi:transcriptional antiterminator RfaH
MQLPGGDFERAAANSTRWYAASTQPHREARAALQLENQGFRAFLPKRVKTIRHARKLMDVTAPLFPRYIFVQLDLTRQPWRSVNGTFGVSSLIMQGERPHPVLPGIVESLLASAGADGVVQFHEDLEIGSKVRLLAGPFAEQLGILARLDDKGRVRVLLEIMGGRVPVDTRREFVVAA